MSEVLDRLRRSVERQPEQPDAHRELVRALLRRRRYSDAAAAVLRIGKATGDEALAHVMTLEVLSHWLERAGVSHSTGPRDDLPAELREALDHAWDLVENGRPATAQGLLRRLRPDYATQREASAAIEFVRGAILERLGQLDDALSAWNQAVQSSRRRTRIASALLQKGRILDRIRLRDGAIQHYHQALRYDGGNMEAVGALLRCGEQVPPALTDQWLEVVGRLDGRTAEQGLRQLLTEDLARP